MIYSFLSNEKKIDFPLTGKACIGTYRKLYFPLQKIELTFCFQCKKKSTNSFTKFVNSLDCFYDVEKLLKTKGAAWCFKITAWIILSK